MNDVKWIKLSTDIFNNHKMLYILRQKDGRQHALIWFYLLATAGKGQADGVLRLSKSIPLDARAIASELKMNTKTVQNALKLFLDLEMLTKSEDNFYSLKNWDKYQSIEQMLMLREYERQRKRQYRKKLAELRHKNDADVPGQINGTSHVREDKSREEESREDKTREKERREEKSRIDKTSTEQTREEKSPSGEKAALPPEGLGAAAPSVPPAAVGEQKKNPFSLERETGSTVPPAAVGEGTENKSPAKMPVTLTVPELLERMKNTEIKGTDRMRERGVLMAEHLFSQICPTLSCVLTDGDRKAVAALAERCGKEGLRLLFTVVSKTDFLTGGGSKGWKASLAWIAKGQNAERILRGEFEGKKDAPREGWAHQDPALQKCEQGEEMARWVKESMQWLYE